MLLRDMQVRNSLKQSSSRQGPQKAKHFIVYSLIIFSRSIPNQLFWVNAVRSCHKTIRLFKICFPVDILAHDLVHFYWLSDIWKNNGNFGKMQKWLLRRRRRVEHRNLAPNYFATWPKYSRLSSPQPMSWTT